MAQGRKLKQEDYTALADAMLVSFERDLADFNKVFRTIDSDFLAAFKKANEDLKNASSSLVIKQSQKQTTKEIYQKADEFREKLLLLKAYVKRAKLDVPLLKETITVLKSRNLEKAIKNTREMLPFFTENKSKIKDMPDDFLSDIPATLVYFETKNAEQNALMSESKRTTSEAKPLYDTLYNYIKEVADAGKVVYKGNPKKEDYTISKIIQRMGVQAPKTIEAKKEMN